MLRLRLTIRPAILGMEVVSVAGGCGSSGRDSDASLPAPGTITEAQVKDMPLEEADDLSIRQNRAGPRPRGLPGVDAPLPDDERVH